MIEEGEGNLVCTFVTETCNGVADGEEESNDEIGLMVANELQ